MWCMHARHAVQVQWVKDGKGKEILHDNKLAWLAQDHIHSLLFCLPPPCMCTPIHACKKSEWSFFYRIDMKYFCKWHEYFQLTIGVFFFQMSRLFFQLTKRIILQMSCLHFNWQRWFFFQCKSILIKLTSGVFFYRISGVVFPQMSCVF